MRYRQHENHAVIVAEFLSWWSVEETFRSAVSAAKTANTRSEPISAQRIPCHSSRKCQVNFNMRSSRSAERFWILRFGRLLNGTPAVLFQIVSTDRKRYSPITWRFAKGNHVSGTHMQREARIFIIFNNCF